MLFDSRGFEEGFRFRLCLLGLERLLHGCDFVKSLFEIGRVLVLGGRCGGFER